MSYEREAIVADSPIVQSTQHQMKEERVVTPYQPRLKSVSGQPSTNDSAAHAEPSAKTEETVTLSPAAAILARKEQKFRQQEQTLKAEKLALEAERKEIADLKALKTQLAAKDYSGLESQVPYNEYTEYLINKQGKLTPEQIKIQELEAKLGSLDASHKDDVSKRFDSAVNERRKAVVALVDTDVKYASIKKANAQEAVVQHILDTWEHDDVELTPEQAAKEVDEMIKEKAKKWAGILEETEVAPVAEQKTLPPLKSGIKTLTNNMAATGDIKRPMKSFQGMSDTERYAEARRRAEEKLKQQTK